MRAAWPFIQRDLGNDTRRRHQAKRPRVSLAAFIGLFHCTLHLFERLVELLVVSARSLFTCPKRSYRTASVSIAFSVFSFKFETSSFLYVLQRLACFAIQDFLVGPRDLQHLLSVDHTSARILFSSPFPDRHRHPCKRLRLVHSPPAVLFPVAGQFPPFAAPFAICWRARRVYPFASLQCDHEKPYTLWNVCVFRRTQTQTQTWPTWFVHDSPEHQPRDHEKMNQQLTSLPASHVDLSTQSKETSSCHNPQDMDNNVWQSPSPAQHHMFRNQIWSRKPSDTVPSANAAASHPGRPRCHQRLTSSAVPPSGPHTMLPPPAGNVELADNPIPFPSFSKCFFLFLPNPSLGEESQPSRKITSSSSVAYEFHLSLTSCKTLTA